MIQVIINIYTHIEELTSKLENIHKLHDSFHTTNWDYK